MSDDHGGWETCRFLTCSVLPVRVACNLSCPFCFSRSSISALRRERVHWRALDVEAYYRFARERGATRLVITGGGEPLLRADDVVWLIEQGRGFFDEVACFTNGTLLTAELSRRLVDAGLSYLCWSRHAAGDAENRALMGDGAPDAEALVEAAGALPIRATCVMTRGNVEGPESAWRYIAALHPLGITQYTLKHTYVAYERSVFRGSPEDRWAARHQIEADPFVGVGREVAALPWGPSIRRVVPADEGLAPIHEELQICYYREPTPAWELQTQIARSCNLLSDGQIYGSLEDRQSLLWRLPPSRPPSETSPSSASAR